MKHKLLSLLIAIVASVGTMVAEPITVGLVSPYSSNYTVPSSSGIAVYLWAWTSNGNLFESWPGVALVADTLTKGNGYLTEDINDIEYEYFYTYTFDENIQDVNIVWYIWNGYAGTAQSADINHITSSTYFDFVWNTEEGVGNWLTVQPIRTDINQLYYELENTDMTAQVFGSSPMEYYTNHGLQDTLVIPSFITQCGKTYNVTRITHNAFKGYYMSHVTIPNSVTYIGEDAFYHCTDLTSVTIGNSVTSIGLFAFIDCYNLTSVTCLATTPPSSDVASWGYDSMSSMTLFVPYGSLSAYQSHEVWGLFGHIYPIAETCPDYSNCELELVGTAIAPQANASVDGSAWNWGNVYPMGKPQKEGVLYTWRANNVEIYRYDYCAWGEPDCYTANKEFKIRTKNAMSSGGIDYFDYGYQGLFSSDNLYVEATDFYDITFSINAQTGEIEYSCVVSETPQINYYTIRFVNYDGSELLKLTEVEEGTIPVYTGPTPTKPADNQYTYTFSGWSPTIVAANTDATYTAQFTASEIPMNTCEDVHTLWLQTGGSGLGEITTNNTAVWTYNSQYGAYGKKQGGATGWLLTPAKDLSGMKYVTLSFSHTHRYAQTPSEELTLWVCADYKGSVGASSWQQLTISPYAANTNWTYVNVSIDVPLDKVGENTVFGFKYVSTSSSYSTWEIKNLKLDAECDDFGTDIENVASDTSNIAYKVLKNGQILILRGDKTYTLQGQEVK